MGFLIFLSLALWQGWTNLETGTAAVAISLLALIEMLIEAFLIIDWRDRR